MSVPIHVCEDTMHVDAAMRTLVYMDTILSQKKTLNVKDIIRMCRNVSVLSKVPLCNAKRLRSLLIWLTSVLVDHANLSVDDRTCLNEITGTPDAPQTTLRFAIVKPTPRYRREVTRCLAHAHTVTNLAWRCETWDDADVAESEERYSFGERLRSSQMILCLFVRGKNVIDVVVDAKNEVIAFQTHRKLNSPFPHTMPSTPILRHA